MRSRITGYLLPFAFAAVASAAPAQASVMSGSMPNPDDVDLVLWLKADALTLGDGAAVERWPDARGHGGSAIANGAAAPSYSADALDGLPAVRFDGAQRGLFVDESVKLGREHTIVVFGHARTEVEGHADMFVAVCNRGECDSAQPPSVAMSVRKQRAERLLEARYPRLDRADSTTSAASAALNGPTVLAQVRGSENYTRAYAGHVTPPLIRVNTATGPTDWKSGALRIGGSDDPATFLTGDVFEVLVYDRALSVRELRDVFDYLTSKWSPSASAKPRVVLQYDRSAPGATQTALTFGGRISKPVAADRSPIVIVPDGAAHSPDVWYRDRGRSGFDLLDGSLDLLVRFGARSASSVELDGSARGLAFALRSTGPNAFEAQLAIKDAANAVVSTLVATAKPVHFAANTLYHVAVTLATHAADGGITLRLFAAPANLPIDVSRPTFEIASATGPPIDRSSASPARSPLSGATNDTQSAFNAAAGLRVAQDVLRLRVWRGVPQTFDASTTFPDLTSQVTPQPEPAYPDGFDPFTPPVAAARPPRGAPAIAEWTRSGTSGDSLALTGDQLSAFDGDDAGKDTKFAVFGQSAESRNLTFATVRRVEGRRGVIGLDEALPASSMYLIWPGNSRGFGNPVAVNQTEAWWIGPDRATRGGLVYAYGRNLSHDGGTSSAFLYLKPRGRKAGRWISPTNVNPYRVGFVVPADLPNGTYELWAHNGHGGRYGWSKPVALTIDDGNDWSGATIDVSANGTDASADDAAIQSALREADRAAKTLGRGATVRFPPGRFYLTQTIAIPSNVRVVGAGKGKTVLAGMRAFVPTANLMLFERTHDIEIADLTLDFSLAVPDPHPAFVMTGVVDGLQLNRVRLIAVHDKQLLTYLLATRTVFADCDFIGLQVALLEGRQVSFERCNFYMTGNSITLFATRGVRELSVSNCTAQDYNVGDDNTGAGWSQGRFVNIVNGTNTSRDVYIGENATFNLGVHPKDPAQNTGEQISWDEAVVQPPSAVVHATNDPRQAEGTAQLPAAPPPLEPSRNYIAVITHGKGEGQVRDVTSIRGKSIRVSPGWNVVPDVTSTIVLGGFHERAVVYRNHLDGKASQSLQSGHTASSGIEPYGGVSNMISDGNTITDCRHGLFTMGLTVMPTLFNLYTNNLVVGSRYGFVFTAGGTRASDIAIYGQVVRANTVASSVENVASFWGTVRSSNLDMLVFDGNLSTDTPAGYVFNDSEQPSEEMGSVVVVDDYVDRGSAPLAGSFAINAPHGAGAAAPPYFRPYLRGTTWQNFATKFAGEWPSAPELPTRQVTVSARTGDALVRFSVPLFNGGSSAVTFRIARTPSAAWLSIPQAEIELAPQAEVAVPLVCNPHGLRPGSYDATLYVVGVGAKRAVSVRLTVVE